MFPRSIPSSVRMDVRRRTSNSLRTMTRSTLQTRSESSKLLSSNTFPKSVSCFRLFVSFQGWCRLPVRVPDIIDPWPKAGRRFRICVTYGVLCNSLRWIREWETCGPGVKFGPRERLPWPASKFLLPLVGTQHRFKTKHYDETNKRARGQNVGTHLLSRTAWYMEWRWRVLPPCSKSREISGSLTMVLFFYERQTLLQYKIKLCGPW